jgi:hypothetical protein
MKRLWQAAMFLISAMVGINPAMPHESLATTTTVLSAKSSITLKGKSGGQPVETPAVRDQSGMDKYTFVAIRTIYRGYRVYSLPLSTAMPTPSETRTPTPFSSVTPPFDGIWRPAPGTTWQWQLDQPIDTSYDVQMYDIDLFDTPQTIIDELHTTGRVVICYFSAGSREAWRLDAALFPTVVLGNNLAGWAGEKWVDIRRIDLLGPIMTARLELAVLKGCDGVEPDNVEAYTNNSGFPLTYQDQIAYNRWLATEAHKRGLSVGLKNDLEQIPDLVGNFDWALNEQCFQYHECELLQPFVKAGKAVFGVEYEGNPATFCPKANTMGYSWLKKNLSLDAWQIPCW